MSEELIGGYIHPEMSHEEALRLQQKLADWDWEKFRREAAKDILCVLIGKYQNHSFGQPSTISLCEEAIGKADELIKQLKENGRSEKKESV